MQEILDGVPQVFSSVDIYVVSERCLACKKIPAAEILLDTLKPPDRIVTYLGNLERSSSLLFKYCIPDGYLW